jgi:predicted AlkP superfamily pyrophosphatase or phosphodiesterase
MRWLIRAALSILAVVVVVAVALGILIWSGSGDYPAAPTLQHPEAYAPLQLGKAEAPSDRSVVLLVFDGLAPALVRATPHPSLDRIARDGVSTLAMTPVFPTLSMPNHVSLSTGCYPERHGVVSNRFIDPVRGLYAEKGDAVWLEACEHLSEIAERQGVRASIFGWMGSHRGEQLLMSNGGPYEDPPPSMEQRMDQVIAAFERTGDRSRFIASYVDEPDHVLHFKGFDGPEAPAMMKEVDAAIGRVIAAIDKAAAWDRTTLIVTTDHGLVPVTTHLNVGGVLRRAGIEALVAADGSIAHVYLTDPSTRDAAVAKLKGSKQFDVIVPGKAPEWAHLGTSKRLGDLVISTKPGFYMFDRGIWPAHLRFAERFAPDELSEKTIVAAHGYPPSTPGVESVFFAMGAGIAKGASLKGLRAIDVHPTIATLLSVAPGSPIDGVAFRAALTP